MSSAFKRPDIGLLKFVWDPSTAAFTGTRVGRYRHTDKGWISASAT